MTGNAACSSNVKHIRLWSHAKWRLLRLNRHASRRLRHNVRQQLETWRTAVKTIEMDMFAKYKKEIAELKAENAELHRIKTELEQRLQELHGEYMLLRYQFKGLPSHAEILKLRQEMLSLKKELRMRGWTETSYHQ
jgi:chromosome segregation ATPase